MFFYQVERATGVREEEAYVNGMGAVHLYLGEFCYRRRKVAPSYQLENSE